MAELTRRELLKGTGVLAIAKLLGLPIEPIGAEPEMAEMIESADTNVITPASLAPSSQRVPVLLDGGFAELGVGAWLVTSEAAIELTEVRVNAPLSWDGKRLGPDTFEAFTSQPIDAALSAMVARHPAELIIIRDFGKVRVPRCYITDYWPNGLDITIKGEVLADPIFGSPVT